MSELTIFTPTYNRVKKLYDLYESLIRQTNKDFVWMIIDDGSTDETEKVVSEWRKNCSFEIDYFYQNNQGKHIAMKNAIEHCNTEWLICVDSDDCLTKSAVSEMLLDINSDVSNCIGYIYPRKMDSKNYCFPQNAGEISVMDAKNIYEIPETAIVFKSKYLKLIKIPQFGEEKFLSEEVLYIQLDYFGKFCTRNRTFYVGAYQCDGLTAHVFQLWIQNSQGAMRLLNDRYNYSKKYSGVLAINQKIKTILNINGLCIATKRQVLKYTPNKTLSIILYLPSVLFAKIRFKRN